MHFVRFAIKIKFVTYNVDEWMVSKKVAKMKSKCVSVFF